MTNSNASRANKDFMPEPIRYRGGSRTVPTPILTQGHWDEIRDAIVMALDALGDGPATTDRDFCWCNLGYARSKLKRAHRRAQKRSKRALVPGDAK